MYLIANTSYKSSMGYIEETDCLSLDFEKLSKISKELKVIPVAVQNALTNEVILISYTNEEALIKSIEQRRAIFWSTSRNELWYKGLESGNEFELMEIFVNCEQNSLVYKVKPLKGNICHTSYNGIANNCFYRKLDMQTMKLINMNENK